MLRVCLAFSVIVVATSSSADCAKRRVLLWLPTRGKTEKHIAKYTKFLSQPEVQKAVTSVSVTAWQLADDPTGASPLIATDPKPLEFMSSLKSLGYEVYPTIYENGAGPLYPKLEKLFAKPGNLFAQMKQLTTKHGIAGWNLDFEPKEDAAALRNGLTQFVAALGEELKEMGTSLSIDAAGCLGTFWDCAGLDASLSKAAEGRVITMATYSHVQSEFDYAINTLNSLSPQHVGVGFCPGCWNHEGTPLSEDDMRHRMSSIIGKGYCEIDLWAQQFPDMYNSYLQSFIDSGRLPTSAANYTVV